jgi:Mrp family chromosome partitioning ATPase
MSYEQHDRPCPRRGRTHGAPGATIARHAEKTELTPAQLAERAIIPYTNGANRALVNAFRDLRTRLLATSNENFITLVAPVSPGCGADFVARNLAISITLDPARTALLVDCNLATPTQHTAMRVATPNGGLLEYLEHPEAEVRDVLYRTGVPRLKLLPAGRSLHGGAETECFSSFRMRLLLDSLRSRYPDRYVVLDGPPVLGAPDARMLAELADVVILVTGYGRNTPAAIAAAASDFDPRKFAGVVFNESA